MPVRCWVLPNEKIIKCFCLLHYCVYNAAVAVWNLILFTAGLRPRICFM
jgi:hypothetical protein